MATATSCHLPPWLTWGSTAPSYALHMQLHSRARTHSSSPTTRLHRIEQGEQIQRGPADHRKHTGQGFFVPLFQEDD